MMLETNNIFINLRDIKTIHIDKDDSTVVVITYLGNGGVTNIFSGNAETAKQNLQYLSKEAAKAQNVTSTIFDKFI